MPIPATTETKAKSASTHKVELERCKCVSLWNVAGSNQCSNHLVEDENGNWIKPPTTERTAKATSGKVIVQGDSCGLISSPASPASPASKYRGLPKNVRTT